MAIKSSGDMFLLQQLLNSSDIYVNAANLSVLSCLVLASSKDIIAFIKTRQLNQNPDSKVVSNLENFVQASALHMRYQKKQEALLL